MKKQNLNQNKLKKLLEEEKKEVVEEYKQEETKNSGFEAVDAFKNIEDGFDPLGGSKFKSTDINRNNDDLFGWHK